MVIRVELTGCKTLYFCTAKPPTREQVTKWVEDQNIDPRDVLYVWEDPLENIQKEKNNEPKDDDYDEPSFIDGSFVDF